MRTFKLVSALIAALAFSALSVANASAAEKLWKLLPGSVGETFTDKGGKTLLTSSFGTLACQKSTTTLTNGSVLEEGSTENKGATSALAVIDFEECTTAGVAFNSVGDAAKQVLIHVEVHTCLIKPGDFGLLFKLLQVHLEVPAAKKLILIRGAFIVLIEGAKEGTKAKSYNLNVKAPEGKQEILLCEGGELNKLEVSHESTEKPKEEFLVGADETKEASLTFDGTNDKEGEEAMV